MFGAPYCSVGVVGVGCPTQMFVVLILFCRGIELGVVKEEERRQLLACQTNATVFF